MALNVSDAFAPSQSRRALLDALAAILKRPASFWLLTGFICLLGLALRLPTLSTRSLWLDEAYTAWFSQLGLTELWTDVPLYETHPPFYYTLIKAWTLVFGTSEVALRSPSVIASVATLALAALSGRILRAGRWGDYAALFAALLLAVNRAHIFYAQSARPYALQTLVALIAILAAIRLVQVMNSGDGKLERLDWLPPATALGLAAGVMLWLHNTAIFIALGIWAGLAAVILLYSSADRTRNLVIVVLTGIASLAIWSPFLPYFLRQSATMHSMSFWVQKSPSDFWSAWIYLAGGNAPAIPVIAAAVLGFVSVWRRQKAVALFVAIVLLLPLYAVVTISHTIKPIYVSRLFEWMAPPLMLLVGCGVFASRFSGYLRLALAVAALGLSVVSTLEVRRYEDWRVIVQTIAAEAEPGDVVIASPTESDPLLRYYAGKMSTFPEIRVIPGAFPYRSAERRYISNLGAPRIEPSDGEIVRDAMRGHRRVWLIERGAFLYDPANIVRIEIAKTHKDVLSAGEGATTVTLFE
jgi:mannosyltransferase